MTAEEVAARAGASDPDFDKLKADSTEREEAKKDKPDEPLHPKRTKDRKGTAMPAKIPIVDEVESVEVADATGGVAKRSKDRKGTSFVKKAEMMPIEDDEDEDE